MPEPTPYFFFECRTQNTKTLNSLIDLSFWYEYHELATRSAIFFSTSTLAGAFNGLVSYGISKNLDGTNGWRAWKWIFLIEGVLPIGFAFVVLFFLPASPSEVRYGFSDIEKEELVQRSERSHNSSEARVQPKKILKLLMSIHFWMFTVLYCVSLFTVSSLSNFLPALVRVSHILIHLRRNPVIH